MTSHEQQQTDSTTTQLELEAAETSRRAFTLPPHDRGAAAWRLLFVAYVFETLLWGFPLSYGVFQEYYSRLPEFQDNPYVGIVGTVASGISYIAAPVIIPLVGRYARYRRHMIWIGWPVCLISLVAGSFARSLEMLIITQGALYGLGFITFYYPILSMVNEYWVARRGMAYGILCSAAGLGGATLPFAIEACLQRYGYPTTLRIIAIGLLVLTGPLIPFLKGRLSDTSGDTSARTDWSFLRTPLFWVYNLSNFAMGLGYFFPLIYLPSFAVSNGFTPTQGALLLALMSISQVLGQVAFGYSSDKRIPIDVLTVTSAVVAAIAAYTLWGLARSLPLMILFALTYGFFASGYTATYARIGTTISADPSSAFAAYGLLNLGKGLGNVLTGPLGGALIGNRTVSGTYGAMKYERIVIFTGSCMLLSGAIILLYRTKHLKWLPIS